MSDSREEDSGGAPWLAPESERGDGESSQGDRRDLAIIASSSSSSSSHARPVSQLLGSLSLSHDAGEGCSEEEMIQERSVSFDDGPEALAAASSSREASSPATTSAREPSTSTPTPTSPPSDGNHQRQQVSGFAGACGSPALSFSSGGAGGDNWVEVIDRAIAEMVRPRFVRRLREGKTGRRGLR